MGPGRHFQVDGGLLDIERALFIGEGVTLVLVLDQPGPVGQLGREHIGPYTPV
jgi:hypothetical protein